MIYDYDVVVAGCGPAGSVCARVLADAGLAVLALDRREFPRDKLCGGLLTWKAMRLLARHTGLDESGLVYAGVVDHVSHDYLIRLRERPLLQGSAAYPFHLVKRRVLDAFLLDRAREAGAEIALGTPVESADPESGEVRLAGGGVVRARMIVGADGVGSRVRAAMPVSHRRWMRNLAQAVELHVPRGFVAGLAGAHEDLGGGRTVLYAGFLPAGYAWVFPTKADLVVGLGGLIRVSGNAFKKILESFLAFLGLPVGLAASAKAHPIPYGNFLTRPHHGRALLCGDAAGFVEPFFGEGIFYAMRTGELAGRAVAGSGLDPGTAAELYRESLRARILKEFAGSMRLRAVMHACLKLGLVAPLSLILTGGGGRLLDMVHGKRSFNWLSPLSESVWTQ